MKCPICKGKVEKKKSIIDGFSYEFFKCAKCGEEILNMSQLHQLANKYRKLKKGKEVKFTKWGNSLAVRVPKNIANDLKIKEGDSGYLIKDKNELRIIPG